MDHVATLARIDRERIEVRYSHAELARQAGIAESTWWRIRRDPTTMTLETLDKLEAAIRAKRARIEREAVEA